MTIRNFRILFISTVLTLAAAAVFAGGANEKQGQAGQPIYFGVSAPLTGERAQYGIQWKKAFDLALEQINAAGGINGRPLAYVAEDSQSDPKQSVTVAQKFVADQRVIAELGDFSSDASMAATPIYQRAGLVQYGFNNSHPDFTKGGDHVWTTSLSQKDDAPSLATFAVKEAGHRKLAVFYLNTDWGKVTYDYFVGRAKELGADITDSEAYLPSETDFRAAITKAVGTAPDAFVLESYYPDAALIVRQLRDQGIKAPVFANGAIYSPKFLQLAGDAAEGALTSAAFLPSSPRSEVQAFVKAYTAKYNDTPDSFSAGAYDAVNVLAAVLKAGAPTRDGVFQGFQNVRDIPSVIYEKINFGSDRRVSNPAETRIVVKAGQFTAWTGND